MNVKELIVVFDALRCSLDDVCYLASVNKAQWIKDQMVEVFEMYSEVVDQLVEAGSTVNPDILH